MDSDSNTVDFLLTAHRDKKAALRFFKKAMRQHSRPDVVTIDKSDANTVALNEQEHRCVKRRTRPMLEFKHFRRVKTVLEGIEWVNMLCKGQYPRGAESQISPADFFHQLTD
ncbi:transposase (fragment) [Xenorhabdus poinarii G6]|uniref:Transposase n=1 Tax=Xenorhabdus poinarii G6 TaxID=1354304 RepID=A0A068R9T5_9GAMM